PTPAAARRCSSSWSPWPHTARAGPPRSAAPMFGTPHRPRSRWGWSTARPRRPDGAQTPAWPARRPAPSRCRGPRSRRRPPTRTPPCPTPPPPPQTPRRQPAPTSGGETSTCQALRTSQDSLTRKARSRPTSRAGPVPERRHPSSPARSAVALAAGDATDGGPGRHRRLAVAGVLRSAAEVLRSAPRPPQKRRGILGVMAYQVTAGRFVGRTHELALLHDLLARAADGEPLVALIGGEAGIGKTPPADQLAAPPRPQGRRGARRGRRPPPRGGPAPPPGRPPAPTPAP